MKISVKQGEAESRNLYSRFLVLVSNHMKDPEESSRVYRAKETVESIFDYLKNEMDIDRQGHTAKRSWKAKPSWPSSR